MLNILVAEDDRGIQTLLKTILTREGFTVDCVSDGAEALQRLGSTRYDVILIDLMMPTLSGAELIARLIETNDDALSRIIVVTAGALHDTRTLPRLPIVRKPFDLDELRSSVRAVGGVTTRQQRSATPAAHDLLHASPLPVPLRPSASAIQQRA
jgi:DNA-binding response OmpR family regulator